MKRAALIAILATVVADQATKAWALAALDPGQPIDVLGRFPLPIEVVPMARSLVALIDGLQLQWLCSTTPGTAAAESLSTDLVAEIRLYTECLRSRWEVQETPETPQRPKAV